MEAISISVLKSSARLSFEAYLQLKPKANGMETVVAVAIAVLATVFVGSLIALILVIRHRYCRRLDFISEQLTDSR